jgi:hypothetical protein
MHDALLLPPEPLAGSASRRAISLLRGGPEVTGLVAADRTGRYDGLDCYWKARDHRAALRAQVIERLDEIAKEAGRS